MVYDFDEIIDRRCSDSIKWRNARHPIETGLPADILPMWIADMDFAACSPVVDGLYERVSHRVFGYGMEPPELREIIVARLQSLYAWRVAPEDLVFLPGVMVGVNLSCHVFARPGDGLLAQTPGYDSILAAPTNAHLELHEAQFVLQDGRYIIDFDAFESAIGDHTRIFALCNPHNPLGRVFRRVELERMAEICLRHDLLICSDEIHCDIIYSGCRHVPIAALAPEIAARTITLMSPMKSFNVAGLHCGFAVIQNRELRQAFLSGREGLVGGVNVMGYVGMLAAYRDGQPWLDEAVRYLQANRDFAMQRAEEDLPGMAMIEPEGTFLAWLDCRQAGVPDQIHNVRFHKFFFEQARVAVYNGAFFGRGGEGFVRLNFACPRPTLEEGLRRIGNALARHRAAPA